MFDFSVNSVEVHLLKILVLKIASIYNNFDKNHNNHKIKKFHET